MRPTTLTLAAILLAGATSAATAQCRCNVVFGDPGFGDTALAYSGGVVYDDDLVPGGGINAPFLVDEQTSAGLFVDRGFGSPARSSARFDPLRDDRRNRRVNSRQLIGGDGRLR